MKKIKLSNQNCIQLQKGLFVLIVKKQNYQKVNHTMAAMIAMKFSTKNV